MQETRLSFGISPFFFLTAFLIGMLNSPTISQAFVWVGAVFISILVHELGHALAAVAFGQSAQIRLTAFGGMTYPIGPKLSLKKEFVMVIMGPLFGIGLFIISNSVLIQFPPTNPYFALFLKVMVIINLVWTVVNLFPVLPLDGGQLLRIGLEGVFGIKGRRYGALISGILALIVALILMPFGLILISVLFFLFAFQNYELFKQLKLLSEKDEDEPIKDELKSAIAVKISHPLESIDKLEDIRKKTGRGMVFIIATQELASYYAAQKNFVKAYELLKPIENDLLDSGKVLLQEAAFETKDDLSVLRLAASCIVNIPSQEVIIRALLSAARQKDIDATLGWLQTAKDYECFDLLHLIEKPEFDGVKAHPEFMRIKQELELPK